MRKKIKLNKKKFNKKKFNKMSNKKWILEGLQVIKVIKN